MRWTQINTWKELVGRVKVGWSRPMRLALDGHSNPRDGLITALRSRHYTLGGADASPPAAPARTPDAVKPEPFSPQPAVAGNHNQTQAKARDALQSSTELLRANAERSSESAGRALSVPNQTLANARKARLAAADRAARARTASTPQPELDAAASKRDSER